METFKLLLLFFYNIKQDIYLTGNPQITFFKVIYRRHTNFAIESIEQTFNGQADWGKKVICPISRNGDLINRCYLRVETPEVVIPPPATGSDKTVFRWLNWLGHVMIKTAEIEMGGQKIDKHYGEWLHIWNELTQTQGHALGYANMVGNTPDLTEMQWIADDGTTNGLQDNSGNLLIKSKPLYIPLQFWFCRNPGLALPLIALQYHDVKITLELRDVKDCYFAGTEDSSGNYTADLNLVRPGSLPSAALYVNYIYLDSDERRRFAQVSHEYLIDQLQFTGDESTSQVNNKFKMNMNHPVKELVWVVQPDSHFENGTMGKQWFNFTDDSSESPIQNVLGGGASGGSQYVQTSAFFGSGENPVAQCKIQLNGHDRFSERDGRYFNLVQPYEVHTNIPSQGINVFSFGLHPEDFQPSGTCNFSRIDNATLNLQLTEKSVKTASGPRSCRVKIFGKNYNVLRVLSGMGGFCEIITYSVFNMEQHKTLSQKTVGLGYLGNPRKNPLRSQWCRAPTRKFAMPAVSRLVC